MRILTLLPCIAIGALFTSTNSSAQGTWEERTGILFQQGRWGAANFVINEVGYTVAGYNGNTDIDMVSAYNSATDTWSSRAPLPSTLRLAAGFSINGKGYVVCGLSGTSVQRNSVYEYDPVANAWTQRGNFPASARYGMASFVIDGVGYVACGNAGSATGPYSTELWAYVPATDSWTQRASMPGQPRFACAGFAVTGKGYVFGGRRSDQSFTNELFEYDPATNTWAQRAALPATPRTYPQVFASGGRGYVVAGSDLDNLGLTDCWAYQPATNSWSMLADYPGDGYWGGTSFAIGDRLFAGLGRFNTTIPNDFYEFISPFVGLAEQDAPAPLQLAPNPCVAGNMLSVQVPVEMGQHTVDLILHNALGQVAHQLRITTTGSVQVVVPDLAAGTYTASLRADGRDLYRSVLVVNSYR